MSCNVYALCELTDINCIILKDYKMILKEFSKFLQNHEEEIIKNKSTITLLGTWIKSILEKQPHSNVEKIIHAEITIAENKKGDYLLIAKSPSGQSLTESLYNFALSYEHHLMKKWLENKKASDFKNE